MEHFNLAIRVLIICEFLYVDTCKVKRHSGYFYIVTNDNLLLKINISRLT